MRSQDTPPPRENTSAPRSPSSSRSGHPTIDVDRARRVWIEAVESHPALQENSCRSMRLVATQLALAVCYDPGLDDYGQCWPTVGTLAEWCGLSRYGVQKILRRLEAVGVLTVTDRRPRASLYRLDVGVDPRTYCSPRGGGRGSNAPHPDPGFRPRSEHPPIDVDRARRLWVTATMKHPALQGAQKRGARLVAIQLALAVCYDPQLRGYGQCWPTVGTLAEWCHMARRAVRRILRRLEASGLLTVTDRRPRASLYTLDVGVDPTTYCSPALTEKMALRLQSGVHAALNAAPKNFRARPNQVLNQPEPVIGIFAGAGQMDSSEAVQATAARPKNRISTTTHHTTNGTTSDSDETRETQYLRTLNINAKDVYAVALQYPDEARHCMDQWDEEGSNIAGVLVKRLRIIPGQVEEVNRQARIRREATRREEEKKRGEERAWKAAKAAESRALDALRDSNRARMALLSEAQQDAARVGAIDRLRMDKYGRILYRMFRAEIEEAGADGAVWEALDGSLLPRNLGDCLKQALDALDEGKGLPSPPVGEAVTAHGDPAS